MENSENTRQETVQMSAEEKAQFEAFKKEQQKKAEKEKKKADREAYKDLINETIEKVFPELVDVSKMLSTKKTEVYDAFNSALGLKSKVYGLKSDQRSHTFTNKEGTKRIKIGYHEIDAYDDTVNEGIAKVKKFIESCAGDNKSKLLVHGIMKLLAKDAKGNLKASRVMQLKKLSEESGDETFIEGVNIIESAYRPEISKSFVQAQQRADNGSWINIPLGMTEAKF